MLYSLTMSRTSLYVTNQGKPGLWVSLLSSCALNCPFTVVMQDYKAYVNQEHVIRGNDVLFKCDVPSFVADFVSVQSWADNEGVVHATHSQGNREICIRQLDIRNALDLRLSFLLVLLFISWFLNWCHLFVAVIHLDYEVDVFKETVIRGNDALLKCQIPSFISDLVTVDSWVDSRGNDIRPNDAVIGN